MESDSLDITTLWQVDQQSYGAHCSELKVIFAFLKGRNEWRTAGAKVVKTFFFLRIGSYTSRFLLWLWAGAQFYQACVFLDGSGWCLCWHGTPFLKCEQIILNTLPHRKYIKFRLKKYAFSQPDTLTLSRKKSQKSAKAHHEKNNWKTFPPAVIEFEFIFVAL